MPGYETERFEGKLEFPLNRGVLKLITFFIIAVFSFLFLKTFHLQAIKGGDYEKRASGNFLRYVLIPAPRGIVEDRNGVLIVWNEEEAGNGKEEAENPKSEINDLYNRLKRKYSEKKGVSHILGFLGFNSETDGQNGNFKTGKAGIEKFYDGFLRGKPGLKITEVDSLNNIISGAVRNNPEQGEKIILTIDAILTDKFYEILNKLTEERGFTGGAGVIIDVNTGEILSLVSVPEYSSEIMSEGKNIDEIKNYLNNPQNIFLNRTVSGLYAPGSIIKPLIALAALNENVISSDKVIFTKGSISVPNPYVPGEYAVFRDWKNHGAVDMQRALAVSSDAYFYTIGGGHGDVKGLGINLINKYFEMFNLDKKTGIDLFNEEEGIMWNPELKQKIYPNDPIWRLGDTYNASIGQGNFQITPIGAAVYTAALANKGVILKPRLTKISGGEIIKKLEIPEQYFDTAQKGMQRVVLEGTAIGLSDLNFKVAGKTGTAEIGKKYVNSWFIGFWPYENPRYAIAIVLERGSPQNLIGGVSAARELFGWMQWNAPEYIK